MFFAFRSPDNDSSIPVTTLPTNTETTVTSLGTSSSEPHDPGGLCYIDIQLHDNMQLAVEMLRYFTLVLSSLFLIEVSMLNR